PCGMVSLARRQAFLGPSGVCLVGASAAADRRSGWSPCADAPVPPAPRRPALARTRCIPPQEPSPGPRRLTNSAPVSPAPSAKPPPTFPPPARRVAAASARPAPATRGDGPETAVLRSSVARLSGLEYPEEKSRKI